MSRQIGQGFVIHGAPVDLNAAPPRDARAQRRHSNATLVLLKESVSRFSVNSPIQIPSLPARDGGATQQVQSVFFPEQAAALRCLLAGDIIVYVALLCRKMCSESKRSQKSQEQSPPRVPGTYYHSLVSGKVRAEGSAHRPAPPSLPVFGFV